MSLFFYLLQSSHGRRRPIMNNHFFLFSVFVIFPFSIPPNLATRGRSDRSQHIELSAVFVKKFARCGTEAVVIAGLADSRQLVAETFDCLDIKLADLAGEGD